MENVVKIEDRDDELVVIEISKISHIYNNKYGGVISMDNGKDIRVKAKAGDIWEGMKERCGE